MDLFEDKLGRPRVGRIALTCVLVALLLISAVSAVYWVDAGERAVIFSQSDGVQDQPIGEGFHVKVPFTLFWMSESAHIYNVKAQLYETDAGAASRDLQDVEVQIALRYRPLPQETPWIHQNYGVNYDDIVVPPGVQESVKAASAQFTAEEIIQERPAYREMVKSLLQKKLNEANLQLIEMDIKNIEFSDEFWQAIEDKVVAEQRALEEKNKERIAQAQANQSVFRAEGRARAAVEEARGDARAELIRANATALAIDRISQQLADDPLYVDYYKIQKWSEGGSQVPDIFAGGGEQDFLDILLPTEGGK